MKRLFSLLSCAALIFGMAGCSKKPNFPTIPSTAPIVVIPSPPQSGDGSLRGVVTPLVTEKYVAEDGTLLCYRRYPNFQLILGDSTVETAVSLDLQTRLKEFLDTTADLQQIAQQDYSPSGIWYPYFATVSYVPTRVDSKVLSFHITNRSQTNEIHSAYASSAVSYDIKTGSPLILDDILLPDWSGQALADHICEALSEIADNLDPDYKAIIQQRFAKGAGGSTAWYFSDTGLSFYFDPYDIAPFFMGVVTAEIPYSQLSGLLRSEYFPAAPTTSGEWSVEPWLADGDQRFSMVISMATDTIGESVLLHPSADLHQVTIEVCPDSPDAASPAYTLFTADSVQKGQALKITSDFSDPGQAIKITYLSGGQACIASLLYDWENDCFRVVYEQLPQQ